MYASISPDTVVLPKKHDYTFKGQRSLDFLTGDEPTAR